MDLRYNKLAGCVSMTVNSNDMYTVTNEPTLECLTFTAFAPFEPGRGLETNIAFLERFISQANELSVHLEEMRADLAAMEQNDKKGF